METRGDTDTPPPDPYTRERYIPLSCNQRDCSNIRFRGCHITRYLAFAVFEGTWLVTECPMCGHTEWHTRRGGSKNE